MQTDVVGRLPTENDPATLGLVDLTTNEFIPLTQTHAWNFQQGCMVHWLARAVPKKEVSFINTTAFTISRDGTNLQRCFPDDWGGSHFDWLNDDELMVTAKYEGKQYGHILFTIGQKKIQTFGQRNT